MTAVSDADGTSEDLYADRVEALSAATARLHFDPFADIDWDAPENQLDKNDPRWQLAPDSAPLAATDWYAEQPLKQRIDMGRWIQANTFKVGIQFEMILIRGIVHYAGKLRNSDSVFRYLMHEITDECNHIQMFQEFINRNAADVADRRSHRRFYQRIPDYHAFHRCPVWRTASSLSANAATTEGATVTSVAEQDHLYSSG